MTGYSGTPLIKKLGITETMKIVLLQAPPNYADLLGTDISAQLRKGTQVPDLVHLFAANNAAFLKGMKTALAFAAKNTQLVIWVSWYKKVPVSKQILSKTISGILH